MASVFTGLYPRSHGMVNHPCPPPGRESFDQLDESFVTLAEFLRARGYSTFGISSNPHLTPERGINQGFDIFAVNIDADDVAEQVYREALGLKERLSTSQPYFFWIHFNDPHYPYSARSPWIEKYTKNLKPVRRHPEFEFKPEEADLIRKNPADLRTTRGLYDSEINYTDHFIGKLFQEVLQDPDSLIIITADHGEEFQEHDGLMHADSLFEEVLRVPLIIVLPGEKEAGTVISKPVSINDIYPTILDYLGYSLPSGLQGTSLLPLMRGAVSSSVQPVFSELERPGLVSVRQGRWKLIRKVDPGESFRRNLTGLFDLTSDPGEKRNLVDDEIEVVGNLEAYLRTWETSFSRFTAPRSREPIPPEELESLKALGYLD